MRILVVLAALVCATAHSDSATLPSVNVDAFKDWHRDLDANALVLPEFSVEAKTAGEALKQTMEAYGVSVNVYLNPATQLDEVYHYRGSNVSLATVLEAIGDHYGLKLERDEDTGVSWLLPVGMLLENILSYHVTIEEARPGWPMYSGLLASLERQFTKAALKGEEPALGVNLPTRGIVGAREATFDIPTNVQAGRYQAIDILHHCNQLAPWLSFLVWDDGHERFPHFTINPMQVSGGNCSTPTPGWTALWKTATNGAAPDIEKALQSMLQSEAHNVFAAHLAGSSCRYDQPYLDALNSAATPLEKANVFNGYAIIRLNVPNASIPAALSGTAEQLLDAGFYEKVPASIALTLLLNMAVAQRTQAAATAFLTAYAGHRAFSESDLRGAEDQIGKAAYLSEAVWRALMDTDATSYIDTGGWAATFLPETFRRLEYQNFLAVQ